MYSHPVLGVALCTWLRKTIADPEFYRDNYAAAAKVPTHFLLLDEVAQPPTLATLVPCLTTWFPRGLVRAGGPSISTAA